MKFFDRKNKIDCLIYLKVCRRLPNTCETANSSRKTRRKWKRTARGSAASFAETKRKSKNSNELLFDMFEKVIRQNNVM